MFSWLVFHLLLELRLINRLVWQDPQNALHLLQCVGLVDQAGDLVDLALV